MSMKRIIWTGPAFLAVEEDGFLTEYIPVESGEQAGDILLGKVERLIPGMNCAFVDIGRKKNGFLPLKEESGTFTEKPVRSGETLILQVKKEETGGKGAYLTRDITLPKEKIILMPMNRYIGVSSRVTDESRRERLKETGRAAAAGRFGLVMRNAAAEAEKEEIQQEAEEAYEVWRNILSRAKDGGKPGTVLFSDNQLQRLQEDYAARGGTEVKECEELQPALAGQLRQATGRQISLPGGGNIVADRCEAMTVIDVNTASAAGKGSKERTVTETNLEACDVIARQVRLRNLSGIIIIDFIDMDNETDRSLVMSRLEACFRNDRVKTVIHGWTNLGLVEMTRKRTRKEIQASSPDA